MTIRIAAPALLVAAILASGPAALAGPDVIPSYLCGDPLALVTVGSNDVHDGRTLLEMIEPATPEHDCPRGSHPEGCMIDPVAIWYTPPVGAPPLAAGDYLIVHARPHGPAAGSPDQIQCASMADASEVVPVPAAFAEAYLALRSWFSPPLDPVSGL